MRQAFHHPVLQWLLVFMLLVAVRGNEGLNIPLSLETNDTIVFDQIGSRSSFPEESLSAQYIKSTTGTGITYLPATALRLLGLSPEAQFFVFYAVQMSVLAFGALFFLRAFGTATGFVVLGTLLAFFSGFTGFGRYLALGGGFKIVTSGLAMGIGFAVLGLHLRGLRLAASVTAALLAVYHPSHGFVLLSILGASALWETFVRKSLDIKGLANLGVATIAALLPFVFFVLLKLPEGRAFDQEAWWLYVFHKTSNLTPLQDGVLVVAFIWAGIMMGVVALRALATTAPDIAGRGIVILVTVLLLWAVQITATEMFRSVIIAQLALTRATPYAVLTIVALLAWYVHRAFTEGNNTDKLTGLFLTLGAIGVALPNILPPFGIPTFTPALYATSWFYNGKVIDQAEFTILSATLAWWMWRPHLSEAARQRWMIIMGVSLLLSIILMGLRISSLASVLILIVHAKPAIAARLQLNKSIAGFMLAMALTVLAFAKNPWVEGEANKIVRITDAIREYVPEDGMILSLPVNNDYSEILSPHRATFFSWSESQYVIYAPQLIDEIWRRAALLGLEKKGLEQVCPLWQWVPMCRRSSFDTKARGENPVWRKNMEQIMATAPVTHVLMPETMACRADKALAHVDDLVLVPVRGLAPAGCER